MKKVKIGWVRIKGYGDLKGYTFDFPKDAFKAFEPTEEEKKKAKESFENPKNWTLIIPKENNEEKENYRNQD